MNRVVDKVGAAVSCTLTPDSRATNSTLSWVTYPTSAYRDSYHTGEDW